MGVAQSHYAITGAAAQFVIEDYQYHLDKAMDRNNVVYQKLLQEKLAKETGLYPENLQTCEGSSNDTSIECPVADEDNQNKTEFIVIVHN